ncbi:MAG: methyltransferase domain-containing protein [Anaerolineae bacterium]|nr:methyltransferase domain-containing protein [Anaerolineae bacterium]
MDLSILILTLRETDPVDHLLTRLDSVTARLNIQAEIINLQPGSRSVPLTARWPIRTLSLPPASGYGDALRAGFAVATGDYLLTLEADFDGPLDFLTQMWARRQEAEVVIASRYIPGGGSRQPPLEALVSRGLNGLLRRGLSLPVRDFSSGFRLYHAAALRGQPFQAHGFAIVQEILVRAYAEGWQVLEIPFEYHSLRPHQSRTLGFGLDYLRTFWSLWALRNSIQSADYDDRAYNSPIPLQRYWQRQRFRHITDLMAGQGPVLDVGCGSSRIIGALPAGSLALDILIRKLRYARRFGRPLVHGTGFQLPFADESFPCVVCSQVIEHVSMDSPILAELVRVLAPGGRLVLGTPDYANWEWVVTEKLYGWFAPGGYADEHIAHYTRQGLLDYFAARGFTHEATRYILQGELILALRKGIGNKE